MPESSWDIYFAYLQENEQLKNKLKEKEEMLQEIQAQTTPKTEELDISSLLKEISLESEEQKDAQIKLLKEQIKHLQQYSSRLQIAELNQIIEHYNGENQQLKQQLTDIKQQYQVNLQQNQQFYAKLAACVDTADLVKVVKEEGFTIEDALEKQQELTLQQTQSAVQAKQENQYLKAYLFYKEKYYQTISKYYTDNQAKIERVQEENDQFYTELAELRKDKYLLYAEKYAGEKRVLSLQSQIEQLTDSYDQLYQVVVEKQRDFTVKLNEKQAIIEEKNNQIVDLCGYLGSLYPVVYDLDECKYQLANLRVQDSEHVYYIQQLSTQIQNLEFAVQQADQKSEFLAKQAQIDVQNAVIYGYNEKEVEMKQKLQEERTEKEDLESQLRISRKEKQQLTEDLEEMDRRIKQKESEIERLNTQIETLKSTVLQTQKDLQEAYLSHQQEINSLAAEVQDAQHSLRVVFQILGVSAIEGAVARIKELLQSEYHSKSVEYGRELVAADLQKATYQVMQIRQQLGISPVESITGVITRLQQKVAGAEAAEIKFQYFVKDNEIMIERAFNLIAQLNTRQLFYEQSESLGAIDSMAGKVTAFYQDARRKMTQMSQSIEHFYEVEEVLSRVTQEKDALYRQNNEHISQITQLKSKELELNLVYEQLKRDKYTQLELEKQRVQQEKENMLKQLNQQKSLISQAAPEPAEKSYEFSDIIDAGDVEISRYPSDSHSNGAKAPEKRRRRSSANFSSTGESAPQKAHTPQKARKSRQSVNEPPISPVESSSSFVYKPKIQVAYLFSKPRAPDVGSPSSAVSTASESSARAFQRKAPLPQEPARNVPVQQASQPRSNKLNSKLAEEFYKLNRALQEQRERSINSSMSSIRVSPNSHKPADVNSVLSPYGVMSPSRPSRGVPLPNFSSPLQQIGPGQMPAQHQFAQFAQPTQFMPYQQPRPVPAMPMMQQGARPVPVPIPAQIQMVRPVPIPQMRGVPFYPAQGVRPVAIPFPGQSMKK